jgi:hypothetical protein
VIWLRKRANLQLEERLEEKARRFFRSKKQCLFRGPKKDQKSGIEKAGRFCWAVRNF